MIFALNSCSNCVYKSIDRKCTRIENIIKKQSRKGYLEGDQKDYLINRITIMKDLYSVSDPYYAKYIDNELRMIIKVLKKSKGMSNHKKVNKEIYNRLDKLENAGVNAK